MLPGRLFAGLFATMAWALTAHAQYGPVDPADASGRVLEEVLASEEGGQVLRALNEWNLPGWQESLTTLLAHEQPQVRMTAVALVGRDDSADLPHALEQLQALPQRTVALRELIVSDNLSADNAEAILDTVQLEPIITAMLHAVDRSRDPAGATAALMAMSREESVPVFARGVAASELAERGEAAPLKAWLGEIQELSETNRNRVLYELALLVNQLDSQQSSVILLEATRQLPVDDLLRATTTAAAMRLEPEVGIPAWQALMEEATSVNLRGGLATILLEVGAEVPGSDLAGLGQGPPLHQKLMRLLEIPAQSRLQGTIDLIQHGHLPTMRWALEEATRLNTTGGPSDQVEAVLVAIIDKAQANPRPEFLEVANSAAIQLALVNPEEIAQRIRSADSPIFREIHFGALAIAGTPRAADATRALLEDPALANRSMALLVVARSDELSEKQMRLLGRAAAGGGRLPTAFRPSAAWLYLQKTDKLKDTISGLTTN